MTIDEQLAALPDENASRLAELPPLIQESLVDMVVTLGRLRPMELEAITRALHTAQQARREKWTADVFGAFKTVTGAVFTTASTKEVNTNG